PHERTALASGLIEATDGQGARLYALTEVEIRIVQKGSQVIEPAKVFKAEKPFSYSLTVHWSMSFQFPFHRNGPCDSLFNEIVLLKPCA
ncbi:MAG: hypothetical protein WA137_10395, partial [Methanothrix sp.]